MSQNQSLKQSEADVRAVLAQVYRAWERNDAEAFVVPYAEDATATLPGSFLASRAAIRATMVTVFAGPLAGSRAVYEIQSVRFRGADTAIVASRGAIVFAGQAEPAPETRSLETWVLTRHDGTWRVDAFHNCPAAAVKS
jgi:uncharacterized protein (TIGR02246 family)